VFDLFTANPGWVALPIVHDERPLGLITRNLVIERFAQPFTREIFGRRRVGSFMESSPLVVECDTDLDDLSRRIVEAGMQHMYDGFILTDGGAYAGMGTGSFAAARIRATSTRSTLRVKGSSMCSPPITCRPASCTRLSSSRSRWASACPTRSPR
jgi:hypothetical protein